MSRRRAALFGVLAASSLAACQMISGLDDLEANGKIVDPIVGDGGSEDGSVRDAGDDAGPARVAGTGAAAAGGGGAGGSGGMSSAGRGGAAGGAGRAGSSGAAGGGSGGSSGAGSGGSGGGGAAGMAPACMPPVSGGVCDPAAQCGCGAAENCAFYEGKLACVARGNVAPYHKCSSFNDCQAGYQCIGGACRKSCKNASDDSCEGDGTRCFQFANDGQPVSGGYACSRDCNPAHPQQEDARFDACGPDLKCDTDGELTVCTPSNPAGKAGQPCDSYDDCAPGMFCTGDWCEPWCEIGGKDCIAGKTCSSLATKTFVRPGIEFGFCCGSPSGNGPCDTAPQCGCAENQTCRITDANGTTACAAFGNVKPYAACDASADCGKGFTCVNSVCKAMCDSAIVNYCNGGTCVPARSSGATTNTPGYFICRQLCNPVDPYTSNAIYGACGSGTACGFTSGDDAKTDCFVLSPSATGAQGASCNDGMGMPDGGKCAARHFCWSDTLLCAQYCQIGAANACPAGLSCYSFATKLHVASIEIGYCE